MKEQVSFQRSRLFAFLLFALCSLLSASVEAKIYIDITSPASKLPIAIFDLPGSSGREMSEVIREDLIFTGLFQYIDKASYVETLSQPFNAMNWKPLGIEAVVKGNASGDSRLTVQIALYDAVEGKELMNKQYQAERELLRPLAHSISNDIYKAITGQTGFFRTRTAFVADDGGEKGIYLMDWDGHRIRRLGLKGTLMLTPHWSADGSKMIYSSERGRQWGIYLLDFTKMKERRVFTSNGTNIAGDFFPGENAFAFSSTKDGSPEIYVYNIDTGKVKKTTSSYGIDVSPAVSPDGSQIAFVSDRGGAPQIYLMRSDGSDVKRLTFEGSYNTSPAWSPKSDRIVFSSRRGGKNQIVTMKPDGSDVMQLTEQGNNEDPSFSPDGRYITFTSDREGAKGIYIMRANGEAQKRITPKGMRASGPRWSPN